MEPYEEYLKECFKEEEIKNNLKNDRKQFKNKIGKQRRNCWWN